jgi:hypothetical protein
MFDINSEKDVPGMIEQPQCDTIIKVAQSLPKNAKVLEIGCWAGRSTWTWLNGLSPNAHMVTVDPFMLDHKTGKHRKRQMAQKNQTVNTIMNYFLEHGGEKTWRAVINQHPNKNVHKQLFVGLSYEFAKQNNEMWDCVYVDGDHSYEGIQSDLNIFEPRTNIICGDDFKPKELPNPYGGRPIRAQPGVVKAVEEMCEKTGRTFWKDPDSCFWMAIKG